MEAREIEGGRGAKNHSRKTEEKTNRGVADFADAVRLLVQEALAVPDPVLALLEVCAGTIPRRGGRT